MKHRSKAARLRRGARDEHEEHPWLSPRDAARVAADHVARDVHAYANPCGERPRVRENPNPTDAYERFHGVEPDRIEEREGMWYPGGLVLLGQAVDVGYAVGGRASVRSLKRGWYVHDFGGWVNVYRRPKANERPTTTLRSFPAQSLVVLGGALGFTYKGKDARLHEVAGSSRKKLAVTPDGTKLVVVGPTGVDYVIYGGNMHVTDWIRN